MYHQRRRINKSLNVQRFHFTYSLCFCATIDVYRFEQLYIIHMQKLPKTKKNSVLGS